MADRPVILRFYPEDPPLRSDPDGIAQAKAVAATEQMCAMLRARGEDVTFGGVFSARKAGAA